MGPIGNVKLISKNSLSRRGLNIIVIILTSLVLVSCNKDEPEVDVPVYEDDSVPIPKRQGERPETTPDIPHTQIDVDPVPAVHDELIRRVYSVPGIEDRPSVVGGWQGLWIADNVGIAKPNALIDEREFAHIHNDGSLHIFLEPSRSHEAVDSCWAVFHPYALDFLESLEQPEPDEGLEAWHGFVLLYTPQSIEELNVTFQLIVDGYNYVTRQDLVATDYY